MPSQPIPQGASRDYSDAWRWHRQWRRLPLVAFLAACTFVIAAGQWPALRDFMGVASWLFGPAFVATAVLANVKLARFPCPRCKQRFNSNLLEGVGLRVDAGKACGHCGLPLYG